MSNRFEFSQLIDSNPLDPNPAQSAPLASALMSPLNVRFPFAGAVNQTSGTHVVEDNASTFVYSLVPIAIAAKSGASVSLATILNQTIGTNWSNIPEFFLSYYGASTLKDWDFNYWNPSKPAVAKWYVNGQDIGPAGDDYSHNQMITQADVGQTHLVAGNDIADFAYITYPIAFNSSGQGTEYRQVALVVVDPKMMSAHAGDGKPTPAEVVASAELFNKVYGGLVNDNDCDKIAAALTAAIGATLNIDRGDSLTPSDNISDGFWRVVYRGSDKGHISDWQTLVKPGDVVRLGWANGGHHTTTVLALNKDGSMKVFDNDDFNGGASKSFIGIHNVNYDQQTIPTTITIFRLSPDHLYLTNGTSQSENLLGTNYNDQILGNAGNDKIDGGVGNDVLNGGAGADHLTGGLGHDTFVYAKASDSTGKAFDVITDFSAKLDKIDVWFKVTGVDAGVKGSLSDGTFVSNLTSEVNAAHLKAHHAMLFTATGGSDKGDVFLIVDANGTAGFQSGHDLVIEVTGGTNLSSLSTHDFV